MSTGEVDLSSLPPEEIFKLLESNNQEVNLLPFVESCTSLQHKSFRWCLRFRDSSMKI